MSFNKSLLTLITEDLEKKKKPSKPRVPKNQWQHPGEVTTIPGNNITMDGVSYPVLGVPDVGPSQMMYPDQQYHFPDAGNVTEYPEMANGGIPERYRNMGFSRVGSKKNSTRPGKKWMVLAKKGDDYRVIHGGYDGMKDYSQHGSEKRKANFWNRMGGKNSSKATDPFSPLYWHKRFGTWADGGQPGLLVKSVNCKGCGHSWKATDGGEDPLTCHKCGYVNDYMQEGGQTNYWMTDRTKWVDSVNTANMDKNFVQRMYQKNGPQMYLPGSKKPSTHFMESGDSRAYPTVVQRPGNKFLEWMNQNNPDGAMNYALDSGQYIQFPNDEQATWYGANGYKTGKGVTIGKKQQGGDSTLENIAEIFDPTGISSWDDVYRSYKNPKDKWYDTAIEAVGAVPLLGKFGKLTKAGIHLKKYKGLEKTLFNMLPQKAGVSKAITTLGKIGRGSDAVQAAYNLPDAKLLPGQGPLNDQARRQRVFDAVRPSTYWDEKNYARYMTGTKRAEFDDPRSEEAFAQYMGLNNNPKYLSPSKYRPSISKDPNAKYYQVDKDLENDIFESYKDKVKMNEILQANEDGVINNIEYDDRMEDDMTLYLTDTDKKFNRQKQVSRARSLGHFTVSRGKDDKGEYLSYYDKYDFPGVIQNEMKGDPYQVYGRMYYPKKATGGQTRDEREMVNGIADILTQVKDQQNRAQIGAQMMQDFEQEDVTYDPQDFREMAQFKNGGHGGLDRWFAEKWVDVKTGKTCGRQEGESRKGYPACRPSKRVNSDTPKTAGELSASEKAKFKREKTSSKRIDYNHKKEEGGQVGWLDNYQYGGSQNNWLEKYN